MKEELNFFEAVSQRRSVRVFDQMGTFDGGIVQKCLEAAILSPNSSNLQLYQFVRVPEYSTLKDRLAQLCMGQKAATTARELVVVLTRRDRWKAHAKANFEFISGSASGEGDKKVKLALRYYGKLVPMLYRKFPGWTMMKELIALAVGLRKLMVWEVSETAVRISVHKSASLASMTFMLAMKASGYDTCPMEGFDSKRVKKLLKLPVGSEIAMIIACGKGLPEGIYGERFRVPTSELIVVK
ncbi:MAG: nitroreductase family protein [Bacteroidetes bacterium]|nr:nitroreductase family protein [Bacteroidota bacterium]